jgi:hypothetical protein
MSKNVKLLIRLAFLTAVLTAALCCQAWALTTPDGINYSSQPDGVTITGGKVSGDLVIPSTIDGIPVTKIAARAFQDRASLTSVTSPSSVTEIGDGAFFSCDNLERVTLSEGLQTLGQQVFQYDHLLTSIVLPDTLTKMGERCFSDTGLKSIKLSNNLEAIPKLAFDNTQLSSIDIPASVQSLGLCAFEGTDITSLVLPDGITNIPYNLCAGCKNLVSVTLPNTVIKIEIGAFLNCTSLTSIALPSSLKELSSNAFGKTGIEELIIPYGTESVSLSNMESLKRLYVPSTVQSLYTDSSLSNCVIYCTEGSKAEQACVRHGLSYRYDNSVDTEINVLYNGNRISFGEYGQNPVAENGRTLIPLRSIFETMGADVQWDSATNTVTATRGGDTISLVIGGSTLYKNGQAVATLDVPAKAINGRTMVPVRAIAEAFNATVEWNGNARYVLITENR